MLCSTIPTLCGATVHVIVTPDNSTDKYMLCSTIPTLCGATVHVIVSPDNKYICYVQPFQHCVAPLFMSLSHPITLQTNICYVQPFQHCVAPLFMSFSHPITNIYVMFNHFNTVWRHCSCHCHTR